MPTAAKAIGALALAALAFIVSGLIIELSPEGTAFGRFTQVNTAVGFVLGWVMIGRSAGSGLGISLSNGLTAAAAMVLANLVIWSCTEMVDRAMNRRYTSPFQAFDALFEIGTDYGAVLIQPSILTTLAVGGMLAGLVAELAGRRWN